MCKVLMCDTKRRSKLNLARGAEHGRLPAEVKKTKTKPRCTGVSEKQLRVGARSPWEREHVLQARRRLSEGDVQINTR